MTDSASRDPDQLASDLVDGLLPPDEAARLRADPQVAAHVARIESVRSALRGSPPPPPAAGALDRMVAAAVDAAGPGSGSGSGSGPRHLQAVPPTPRHNAPPTPPGRSARPWLAAAAAVAVGLAMAGLLSQGGGSDSDSSADMARSGADTEEHADQGAEASEDAGAGDDGGSGDLDSHSGASPESPATESGADEGPPDAATTIDAPMAAHVGSADSPGELADLVRAERAATPDPPPVGPMDAGTCPGRQPQGDASRGVAAYSADAEYQGTPVVVHVYESDGGLRLVATDRSCTDLVDVPFED